MSYSPIVLFIYNRPKHTRKVLESLSLNIFFNQSKLIVYCDGAKNDKEIKDVILARGIVENFDFENKPEIIKREKNYGLSKSIVSGVSEVLNNFDKAIILEDDVVTSPLFLEFMNGALDQYKNNPDVWHISGWNYPNNKSGANKFNQVFFWKVMNCWGWGTWADRWLHYKKNPESLINDWSEKKISQFNLGNRFNFWKQVEENNNGKIDTWAIFWMTTIFENSGFCLNPLKSYVRNIGHDNSGENSVYTSNFNSKLSTQKVNIWPNVNEDFESLINNIANQNFKQEKLNLLGYIMNYLK